MFSFFKSKNNKSSGGKKQTEQSGFFTDSADAVKDKAEQVADAASEKFDDVKETVQDGISDAKEFAEDKIEDAKDTAEDAKNSAEDKAEDAKDTAEDAKNKAEDKVEDVKDSAEDNLEDAQDSAEDIKDKAEDKEEGQSLTLRDIEDRMARLRGEFPPEADVVADAIANEKAQEELRKEKEDNQAEDLPEYSPFDDQGEDLAEVGQLSDVEVISDDVPEEDNGLDDYEPSTEERGDVDEIPGDDDFKFIDSDEAYDEEFDKGHVDKSEEDIADAVEEEVSSDHFAQAAQDHGYPADEDAVDDIAAELNDAEDNTAEDNTEVEDLESYFAPLDESGQDSTPVGIDPESDEDSHLELSEEDLGLEDTEDVDQGVILEPNDDVTDITEAEHLPDQETVVLDTEEKIKLDPLPFSSGLDVPVETIIFSDCADGDEFQSRINSTLDNREVFVFDFTDNKTGYDILPDSAEPQYVELPEGKVSPLDARRVFTAAFDHPGSVVVVVGPEVLAKKIEDKFDRGSQGYLLIVDKVVELINQAGDHEVEVVTIGAESSDLIRDITTT